MKLLWMRPLLSLVVVFSLSVALLTLTAKPAPSIAYAQAQLPAIVSPVGEFANTYEQARPASIRIEARLGTNIRAPLGVGTGFFISEDGYVLTAHHVVDRSEISPDLRRQVRYVGLTSDEEEYTLSLVGFDAYLDLAILKADVDSAVPYLPLAESKSRVGEEIVAIGNSRGDFLEARAGRIVRVGVDSPNARFVSDTLELTASLQPGDSGGPILNEQGEAVGVVSYISFNPDALDAGDDSFIPPYLRPFLAGTRTFASYAVPVESNADIIDALLAGEVRDRPVIGFTWLGDYIPQSSVLNLGKLPGTVIGDVALEGPAYQAGLRSAKRSGRLIEEADVIVAVDDEPTPNFDNLIEVLYRKGVGETVTVTVQRGSDTFKVRLALGAKQEVFR